MNVDLDQNYAGPQPSWPNIVRAIGQAIVMTRFARSRCLGLRPRKRPARRVFSVAASPARDRAFVLVEACSESVALD
jgi:hypothetical protein